MSLLQDPDGARYEDAFKAFMRAYRISPSWKILGNLGLSALKLERYTEGIEAYERHLAEGAQHVPSRVPLPPMLPLHLRADSSYSAAPMRVSGSAAGSAACLLLALSCSRAAEQPSAYVPPRPTTSDATAGEFSPALHWELARLRTLADDFERRGVLDRAGATLMRAYWVSVRAHKKDPGLAFRAGELFAKAWNEPLARRAYATLEADPYFGSQARERAAALPQRAEPPLTVPGHVEDAEVLAALDRGDLARAAERLESLLSATPQAETAEWLGAVLYRQGRLPAAQLAWARARSLGNPITLTTEVSALRHLPVQGVEFALGSNQLLFKDASDELFAWDLRWEYFGALGGELPIVSPLTLGPSARATLGIGTPLSTSRSPADESLAALTEDGRCVLLRREEGAEWTQAWSTALAAKEPVPPHLSTTSKKSASATKSATPNKPKAAKKASSETVTPPAVGTSLSFSPDGSLIFVGTSEGAVVVLAARDGQERNRFLAQAPPASKSSALTHLAVSENGRWLATATEQGAVQVWDWAAQSKLQTLDGGAPLVSLHFVPDDSTLELGTARGLTRLDWSKNEASSHLELKGSQHATVQHAGKWTAIGQGSNYVSLYRDLAKPPTHVGNLQVGVSGLASAGAGNGWAVATYAGLFYVRPSPWSVRRLGTDVPRAFAIAESGKLAAALIDQRIQVFDLISEKSWAWSPAEPALVTALAFTDEAHLAVTAKEITLHDLSGALHETVNAAALLPLQGARLLLAQGELSLETADGKHPIPCERPTLEDVAVSPDRRFFAVVDAQNTLHVYDVTGKEQFQLAVPREREGIALSAGAKSIALLLRQASSRQAVLFAPDGNVLASTPPDWHSGQLPEYVSITPNGLVLGGEDGLLFSGLRESNSGGVHFLESGDWYSIVRWGADTFVDGSEQSIGSVAAFPPGRHPGLIWEFLREPGVAGTLLEGAPAPVERGNGWSCEGQPGCK